MRWARYVRLGVPSASAVATAFGGNPRVEGWPHVENGGRIEIGDGFVLTSSPARSHLVAGPGGLLVIGDHVSIGHGSGVAAHGRTSIGDGTTIGAFVLMMDTNFHKPGDWRKPAKPRTVDIGRGARIGDRVVVLPGASIGDGAVIAPGSVVAGRVRAGAVVAGVPARADRSRGLASEDVAARVLTVIRDVFGLSEPLDLSTKVRAVPGWNLLGGLGLLLDLEAEFGVTISDASWVRVASVQEVVAAVQGALSAGTTTSERAG